MKIRSCLAILLSALLLFQSLGCSWIIAKKPPEDYGPEQELDCNTFGYPVADLAIAGASLNAYLTYFFVGRGGKSGLSEIVSDPALGLPLAAASTLALIFSIASIHGFCWGVECRRALQAHERWAEVNLPAPKTAIGDKQDADQNPPSTSDEEKDEAEPSAMQAMLARAKALPRVFVSAHAGYEPFAAVLHFPVDMGNRLVVGGDIGIRAVSGFIVGPSFQYKWSDLGDGARFLNAAVRLGYIFPFNNHLHMMAGSQVGYVLLTEKEDQEESGTKNQWHGIFLSPLVDLHFMANKNLGFSLAAGLNLEFFDFFPMWSIHFRGSMVFAF